MPFREYTDTQQDTKGPCSCSAFKRGVYEQGLFIIYLFSKRYKDIMFVLREEGVRNSEAVNAGGGGNIRWCFPSGSRWSSVPHLQVQGL